MATVECSQCPFKLDLTGVSNLPAPTAFSRGLSAGLQLRDHSQRCKGVLDDVRIAGAVA